LRLCAPPRRDLPVADKSLHALGLGLVLMAYIVLAAGLLGWLHRWALLLVVIGCAGLGCRQYRLLLDALRTLGRAAKRGIFQSPRRPIYIFLVVWALMTLLPAMAPPIDHDYDGLSQHLASPKLYLRSGEIRPLWSDHHSHFPSTLQMLFVPALAFCGPEAAKVLHWACGIAAALVLIVIGRRYLSAGAGAWAAFALVTVPQIGGLAGLAYVDLASVLFAALLLLGLRTWLHTQKTSHLLLAGLAAAGGMTVKMQGVQLFAVALPVVFCGAIWMWRGPGRAAKRTAVFGLLAVVVAAPWYVKSWVWTGNPVYPFAYETFGGKYWGPREAEQYRDHQLEFGVGSPGDGEPGAALDTPRSPKNLLLAPANLALRPREFVESGLSPVHALAWNSVGPLFLAILPLLALRRPPRIVLLSLAMFGAMWLGWLMMMQYARYLMPSLVFACIPAGYVLADGLPKSRLAQLVPRVVAWACGGVALGFLALGGLVFGSWSAGVGVPDRATYLKAHSESYRFAEWVNTLTNEKARIGLYSEPRGFYLDRDYIWADPGHSRLIEYDRIESGDDLLDAYSRLGLTHIVHRRFGPDQPFLSEEFQAMLDELIAERRVRRIGQPPSDPSYVLYKIEEPWARELLK
ncbi:MAG TPA: glycosyltransferase family 39 protein, partial [Armatimonadota bacterium]|nr:glycosyltransferase family 39 protein [Armatimonadota bacterium]